MQIETVRFGEIEVNDAKILNFKGGLPGLEEYKEFVVLRFEDSYPIFWLQSIEDKSVCLPVVDSFLVAPDYAFNLSDEEVGDLQISSPDELHVLSVLVIPENLDGMTMNLAAPIIININTGSAKQIILNGGEYNVRYPAFADICRLIREEEADAGTVKEDK